MMLIGSRDYSAGFLEFKNLTFTTGAECDWPAVGAFQLEDLRPQLRVDELDTMRRTFHGRGYGLFAFG